MAWFRTWLRGEDAPDAARSVAPADEAPAAAPGAPAPRDGRAELRGHGTGAAAEPRGRRTDPVAEPTYPGARYGLPEEGPGSVATLARRGAQFVLDAVLAGLVASLFTYPAPPQNWSLVSWAVLMLVPVAAFGVTPAMAMLGMRVVRLDRPESAAVGPLWALVRTFSVFFVIPALIVDRDGRGVQDRASRTMVLRSR